MDNKAWKADPPFAGPPVTQDSPGVIPVAFMPADQVQNAFSGETGVEGKIKKKKKKHSTSPLKVEGGRKVSKDEIMHKKQGIDLYGINGPVTVPNPDMGGFPDMGDRPETEYGADETEEAFKKRKRKEAFEKYMPQLSMGMDFSNADDGGGYMQQAAPIQPMQIGGQGGNPYLEQLIAMLSRGGFFRGSPRSQSR